MHLFRPLALGCCGALLAWAGSLLIPDRYTSSAMLRVEVEPFPAADVINAAWQETVGRKELKNLIERFNLYPDQRERLPLEDVIDNIKKEDIKLQILADQEVRVAFTYRDEATARAVANAIMGAMVAATIDRSRSTSGWGRLEVKRAAGPAEATSAGLAFWRQRRYVAQGTLVAKKLDAFVPEPKAEAQRLESLRRIALTPEMLSGVIAHHNLYAAGNNPSEAIGEMRRNLRIEVLWNALKIQFTYRDARLAQQAVSALVTGLIDENFTMPDCPQDHASPPSNPGASSSLASEVEHLLPDISLPDAISSTAGAVSTSEGMPFWMGRQPALRNLSADGECRDPKTPAWARAISLLDPASLPQESDGPSRPILSVFGFFLGLGLWTALRK